LAWYQRTLIAARDALQVVFVALTLLHRGRPDRFRASLVRVLRLGHGLIARTSAALAGVDAFAGKAATVRRELRARPGERRGRDFVPVDVELVDRERVQELLGRDEVLGRARRRGAVLEA
jgi:hypothetical protein